MSDKRGAGVDPTWPQVGEGEHALSEFTADRPGALSPFGDVEFPRDPSEIHYVHPTTVINK